MRQHPSFRSFLLRVGSFFSLVLCFIMVAKSYFPGYEAIASLFACGFTVMFVVVEDVIKRKRIRGGRRQKARC